MSDYDLKFLAWMRQVNLVLTRNCGLVSEDLPDWRYRDAFDDGYTPKEAAAKALSYAKSC